MKIKIKVFLLLMGLFISVGFAHAASSCEPMTFHNVSPEKFEYIKQQLISHGINVPSGNSGVLSGYGISASFAWDGKSGLTLQIMRKPFFVSCGFIENNIGKFV